MLSNRYRFRVADARDLSKHSNLNRGEWGRGVGRFVYFSGTFFIMMLVVLK